MMRKPTLSKRIDRFLEDVFWISYILFIVLAPVAAVALFITGMWTTFFI